MRFHVPFTAALALAALSLTPPLEARSPVHKTAAQSPARTPAPKTPGGKATAKSKHHTPRKKHDTSEDTVPPTITRVHAGSRAHAKPAMRIPMAPEPAPAIPFRRATSSDFVQAAAPPPLANREAEALPSAVDESARNDAPNLPSVEEEAATPVFLPSLYYRRGHVLIPKPLKGSHEILIHQNLVADSEGLERIRDDQDLLDLRDEKLLVPIPTGETLVVDERLPEDRRYCRPWTAQFLSNLSRAYYARFHAPLQVNSAVRTVAFQQHLQRSNGNAAPAEGETASPHLTGQAVDLAKHSMSLTQLAWLRGYLLPLVQQGKVDVEEEFKQSCFHISVYQRYLPQRSTPRRDLATSHHSETTGLATAVE